LEGHGVEGELVVLFDGDQAIRFIEQIDSGHDTTPDLIILDFNLPKRPGREVLTKIRLSVKCQNVPVVILTSSGAIRDRTDAGRLGASRYIVKPLLLEEFIALGSVFREILAGSSSQ
jgi:two-component system response regulator